jgi:hypothetical protein
MASATLLLGLVPDPLVPTPLPIFLLHGVVLRAPAVRKTGVGADEVPHGSFTHGVGLGCVWWIGR